MPNGSRGPLAVMGAMPQEVALVAADVEGARVVRRANRDYHVGTLLGRDVVVVFSRWGKVAAAMTATTLVTEFGAGELLFTGVAGGVDPALRVGDVVVATELIQHDLDARPIFAHWEVPLLGRARLAADEGMRARLVDAAVAAVAADGGARVVEGLVASGDQFFSSDAARDTLRAALPDARCVEMEGAAVAQVCAEHGVPFAVVRTISDAAGDDAAPDFLAFVDAVASRRSRDVVRRYLA